MGKKSPKVESKKTSITTRKKSGTAQKRKSTTINFDYIKSNQFRVIHADGVHGGVCPKGTAIQMAFFSERQPIPRRETYNLDGVKLAGLKQAEVRDAIIREVEVEVLLGVDTATLIHKWLGERIELATKIEREREGEKK